MRTTVDIDDDVLAEIKDIAAVRRVAAGKVISEMLRESLQASHSRGVREGEQEEYTLHGFPILRSRGGPPATNELVRRLRDEED